MKHFAYTLIGFLLIGTIAMAQSQWELVKDKDGIKIFNRRISDSKLKEYRGTVQIKASVNDVVNVLTNPKMQDRFIYKAKKGSVELVKKESNGDIYTYMIIETPWPASNRDIVTLYHTVKNSDGSVMIYVSSVNNMRPLRKGMVRVDKMKGYWKVLPAGNGTVNVEHQAYSSPGGNVPDFLANSASVDAPFDMLVQLRALF